MDIRMFYAELGKLMYAIADVDGVITPQERDALHSLIASRLAHREVHTDEYGTNDAWYTEFEFDVAEDIGMSAEEAFGSFASFMEVNRDKVDEHTREVCLAIANNLADTYHHTNNKEKLLLQQLREVLFSVRPFHA